MKDTYGVNTQFLLGSYEGRVTLYMSTGSLQLRNVTLNDTGEYNVTITRADGTVMNGLTTLNVWGKSNKHKNTRSSKITVMTN
uniref:Immunoglobulin subtype domain-containing protein n=1 Tax=Periophthalmus magnuspinnatus TaxID=409849 RepID=A0A3B4B3C2_9GOBI